MWEIILLATTITSPKTVAIIESPRPTVTKATDVVLLITTVSISSMDMGIYLSGHSLVIPGHEFSGVVVEIGDEVSSFNLDDLVVSRSCSKTGLRFGDNPLHGAQAEYVLVPDADYSLVHTNPVDEERSLLAGGRLGLGIQAAEYILSTKIKRPKIMVWGCDMTGLVTTYWLRKTLGDDPYIVAVDNHKSRLSLAIQFGAEKLNKESYNSFKPDFVVISPFYDAPPINDLSAYLNSNSELIYSDPSGTKLPMEYSRLLKFQNSLICHWPSLNDMKRITKTIWPQINSAPLVSHVIPLEQASEAYKIAYDNSEGTQGVLLKP